MALEDRLIVTIAFIENTDFFTAMAAKVFTKGAKPYPPKNLFLPFVKIPRSRDFLFVKEKVSLILELFYSIYWNT